MPFVGSGFIHEAMSVRGEFSTITMTKFLGAEGTDTMKEHEINSHEALTKHPIHIIQKLSEWGGGGGVVDFWEPPITNFLEF